MIRARSATTAYANPIRAVAAIGILVAALANPGRADLYLWNPMGFPSWSDPNNWVNPAQPPPNTTVPGPPDLAVLTLPGSIFLGSATVGKLHIPSGTFSLIGGSLSVLDSNDFRIGIGSLANVNFTGAVNANGTLIGFGGGTGNVVIGAGATLNDPNTISVGYTGPGSMLITDGGTVIDPFFTIAGLPGGNGTVTVTGDGSTLNASAGGIQVGDVGPGSLTVNMGATVSASGFDVGSHPGALGTVTIGQDGTITVSTLTRVYNGQMTVGGTNSKLQAAGVIHVGADYGDGSATLGILDVNAGGSVSGANFLDIGVGANAVGQVTVGGSAGSVAQLQLNQQLTVGATGTGTLTVNNFGSVITQSLYVGRYGSATHTGTLNVNTGGSATASQSVYIGNDQNAAGTIHVSGQGATLNNTGTTYVGYFGNGTLHVDNRGQMTSQSATIAASNGSKGDVTVDDHGIWTVQQGLIVGGDGEGTVNLSNNGTIDVLGQSITLGDGFTGSGHVTLDGTTALLRGVTAPWTIGRAGHGLVDVKNQAQLSTAGGDVLGSEFQGYGEIHVTGANSLWTANGSVTIGDAGSGVVTIENQAHAIAESAYLGYENTGVGNVSVHGQDGQWTLTDTLIAGRAGHGTLLVDQGARLQSDGQAVLGSEAGGHGEVTITGQNTHWEAGQDIIVGGHGEGKLTVANHATINMAGQLAIGYLAGSKGTLVLDGPDVHITTSNNLLLAGDGEGTVELKNGAKLTLQQVSIGKNSGESVQGTMTVDGNGSTFHSTGQAVIGDGAKGIFRTKNGGAATITGNLTLGDQTNGDGELEVDGAGSLLTANGSVLVANQSKGKIRVTDGGALVINGDVALSNREGSDAFVELSGAQSVPTWTVNGNVSGGKGLVRGEIKDRGIVRVNGNFNAESEADQPFHFSLTGSQAEVAVTGQLSLGTIGGSVLEVKEGAKLTTRSALISSKADGHGVLTITGAGSRFIVADSLVVGANTDPVIAAGAIYAEDEAIVTTTGPVVIGRDFGPSRGEAHVTVFSTWNMFDQLTVGENGNGTFSVSHGSTVNFLTAAPVYVGRNAGSVGFLTVLQNDFLNHVETRLDNVGPIYVGVNGRGNVQFFGHKTWVSSQQVVVQGNNSTVDVSGNWNIDGQLHLSASSYAKIWDGGHVSATSLLIDGNGVPATVDIDSNSSVLHAGNASISNAAVHFGRDEGGGNLRIATSLKLGQNSVLNMNTGSANLGFGTNFVAGTLRVGFNGTLSGTGRVVGKVVNAGGSVHPGGSPGTLTIEGDYEADADSLLQFTMQGLAAGDEYSQLVVTGNATLNGNITLDFENGFAPKTGDVFQLIAATGTVDSSALNFTLNGLAPGWVYETNFVGSTYQLTSLSDAVSLPTDGDYNHDHFVDAADYVLWRKIDGSQAGYDTWRAHFGETVGNNGAGSTSQTRVVESVVPEPNALLLAAIATAFITRVRRRPDQSV